MIYVFEGPRNSGKTFLSDIISSSMGIPRFQFDFSGSFKMLNLDSKSREAHSFAMGKELMIMQLAKDLDKSMPSFIHDRGILSVLTWGILENRISKSQAISQLEYVSKSGLLERIRIIYIDGKNPQKRVMKKDDWDFAEKSSREEDIYKFLISQLSQKNISVFKNSFDAKSVEDIKTLFSKNLL
jgi:hypothetical protein